MVSLEVAVATAAPCDAWVSKAWVSKAEVGEVEGMGHGDKSVC